MTNKIYLGRNCCWFIHVPETGSAQAMLELRVCVCVCLSFPGDEEQKQEPQTDIRGTRGRHFQWHIGRDPCASFPSSSHPMWVLVTLLLVLLLQGRQGVHRAATLHCHLFHFQGRRFFSHQGYFCIWIFFPKWHAVICSCPGVRTRFATGFPGIEGCKPGGKS